MIYCDHLGTVNQTIGGGQEEEGGGGSVPFSCYV